MNIVIPDSWLREHVITKATPKHIQEYLSLCGPSVERINRIGKEVVYDIEVTANRPDTMSVVGVAREAASILPRFGIRAQLVGDPYQTPLKGPTLQGSLRKRLIISTDSVLNPRFTAIVMENVNVAPSPKWLARRLELTGTRAINNVVDITNYIMKLYGQPVHAFDFDAIASSNTSATLTLRASKKGEKVTTLDGAVHSLPGNDIVIEDYTGRLIDLCGIMGGASSQISDKTTTIILFVQTYNPIHIRHTSMALAHRTEASTRFEKSLDPELVLPSMIKGIELMRSITNGTIASRLYDIYPKPYRPYTVSLAKEKLYTYLGEKLSDTDINAMLSPLGFTVTTTANDIVVRVPSFRRDVTIDVDLIEEIARIYGYHAIAPRLPANEPPLIIPGNTLAWEEELKIRLRDWGYTETYTYSMISEELMEAFHLNKRTAYKISNPLSSEWVYMRPSLLPSMLAAISQNLAYCDTLRLFELSMCYHPNKGGLPKETPTLLVAWTGDAFRHAKGLAQAILSLFGIAWPREELLSSSQHVQHARSLSLAPYGWLGAIAQEFLTTMHINVPVVILELDVSVMTKHANPAKKYMPIPKYPPVVEDLSFNVLPGTQTNKMIDVLQAQHRLIHTVTLLDTYKNSRTFRITYRDLSRTLSTDDVKPIREKLIRVAEQTFNATLKRL